MTTDPIFEQWIALQVQPNPDNIELARVLIPSLPAEKLTTYLLTAYYCSLMYKDKPNYKQFIDDVAARLQAQGIDPQPKHTEIQVGYASHIVQPAFRQILDALSGQIDEFLLFTTALLRFDRSAVYWLLGEAFDMYQNNRPCLLNISQDTWHTILHKHRIINSLNEFELPFDYDEGSMGPIPDFIYDFQEIRSIKAGVLEEISPKMERLKQVESMELHTLYLSGAQRLNLRAFPKLKSLKISINRGELTLEGGEQLEKLEWRKESHSEKQPLPMALRDMRALRELQTRCPSYNQVPLPEFEALEKLVLEYASVDFVRDERFLSFRHCKEIYLAGFVSETVPDTLVEFKELVHLHVNSTTLGALPKVFYKLPKLERLEFSGTRMKTIPTALIIHLLRQLKYMRLRCTAQRARDIEKLAAEIGSTCELKLW